VKQADPPISATFTLCRSSLQPDGISKHTLIAPGLSRDEIVAQMDFTVLPSSTEQTKSEQTKSWTVKGQYRNEEGRTELTIESDYFPSTAAHDAAETARQAMQLFGRGVAYLGGVYND
jgi:hypothetical protein